MNQDDFRRLLDSGGGGSGRKHGGARGAQDNITSLDADGIRKLQAKKSSKKKGGKPYKAGGGGNGDDDDGDRMRHTHSQYRDRAAERRQGGTADMIDVDEFKHLDADQSKFLGGDMAHTHLVKGLDFSLLAQLKRERQKLEQATAAEKMKLGTNGGVVPGQQPVSKAQEDAEPTFQTRLGRMVYLHSCQNRPLGKDAKLTKSELFLPGRMYYTFNLLSREFESIPTAIQRSKEDCPELDDVVTGLVDEMTISDVKRAMEEKHTTKKMRRKREESKSEASEEKNVEDEAEQSTAEPSVDPEESKAPSDADDFDIFPDAGEYVPAYLRDDEKPSSDLDKMSQGYFSNLSASLTEAEREAQRKEREAEDAWKATLKKAAAAQSQAEEEEAKRARAAKLAAAQDSYGEYQMGGDEDSDEDEEENLRKRKAAADAKKGGAAKEVDGEEMARRKKQKQGNKLENDLKKINQLMESKK